MDKNLTAGQLVRATYEFKDIPRLYKKEFYIWEEAIERWKKEGLPEEFDYREYFMLDQPFAIGTYVDLGWCEPPFNPYFAEKVIEEKSDYEIIQDTAGRLLKVFKGKRHGFMPGYIKHTVCNREDWENNVRPRLKWDDKQRWEKFNENIEERIFSSLL